MSEYQNFINAKQLIERRKSDAPIVIDCRFALFDPTEYGRKAYEKSHIAGAYYLDMDEDITEDKGEHGGRRGLPDAEVLGRKLSDMGAHMDSPIVCYDDGVYSSPRLWFQLTYMGYTNVKVLDGGFHDWQKLGLPIDSASPKACGGGKFVPCFHPEMLADKDYILSQSEDASVVLVDSREPRRYTGAFEPLYKKAGHIPRSLNIHYLSNLQNDWSIGGKKLWEKNFSKCLTSKETILYCGSAIEACINFMFLTELGRQARVYIGGMSDWVTYDDLHTQIGSEQSI